MAEYRSSSIAIVLLLIVGWLPPSLYGAIQEEHGLADSAAQEPICSVRLEGVLRRLRSEPGGALPPEALVVCMAEAQTVLEEARECVRALSQLQEDLEEGALARELLSTLERDVAMAEKFRRWTDALEELRQQYGSTPLNHSEWPSDDLCHECNRVWTMLRNVLAKNDGLAISDTTGECVRIEDILPREELQRDRVKKICSDLITLTKMEPESFVRRFGIFSWTTTGKHLLEAWQLVRRLDFPTRCHDLGL